MPANFFQATWRTVVGLALLAEPVWRGVRWLLDWGGIIDFIAQHWAEPGWVGAVIGWVWDAPPWFMLVLTAAGLGFIYWDARRRRALLDTRPVREASGGEAKALPPVQEPVSEGAPPAPGDGQQRTARKMLWIGRRTYVGRVEVSTNRLESDFMLEFAFVAFNGTPSPLRLSGVRGRIAYSEPIDRPEGGWATLPTPAVRDDNPTEFAPLSEFMVVVQQSVPGALASEMGRALSAGGRVMFVLEGIDVVLADESDEERGRLPVWERVTCERWGERTITGRIVLASASADIRLG